MERAELTCPVCGYRFDFGERSACGACPINQGCNLLCCPRCGHSTIDPNGSRAARGLMRLFRRRGRPTMVERQARVGYGRCSPQTACGQPVSGSAQGTPPPASDPGGRPATLRDLSAGGRARVCAFAEHTPLRSRETLTAYGVCPGQWVCVRRTSPVTVVEIDQLELALEGELAELIEIDELDCPLYRPE